ncbi:MAG: phosphotransferase [Alteromonadaceae bacterium]|nr:phosphotransferase [Alteromonadaceae bacterium]
MIKKNVDEITNDITDLPCFSQRIKISEIKQGYSHQCYKVTEQGIDYFVKFLGGQNVGEPSIPKQNTPKQNTIKHVDVCTEQHFCLVASAMGITPALYYQSEQWLVSEYIQEKTLADLELPLLEKAKICIEVMSQFHQISIDLPELKPETIIDELLGPDAFSEVISEVFSVAQREFIQTIKDKLNEVLHPLNNICCHGDINFANVFPLKTPKLVDFECVCLADVEYDLAMMVAVNEIPLNYLPQLVSYYQKISPANIKIDTGSVMRYLVFCYLINGLWYFKQYKSTKEECLLDLALNQFNCFDQLKFVKASLFEKMR